MNGALSWREKRRRERLFRRDAGLRAFLEGEFRARMGFPADLAAPKRLSERLLALRLTDQDPLMPLLAAYPAQLEYLRAKRQERALPKVCAEGDSPRALQRAGLPERALVCPTHLAWGGVLWTRENRREAARTARAWLGESEYLRSGAWEYRSVRPGLIALAAPDGPGEEAAFLCLGGEVRLLFRTERPGVFFDATGLPLRGAGEPFRPEGLEQATLLCRSLAEEFPFLRVDVSFVRAKPVFAGLRFFADWGTLAALPAEIDAELGSFLPLRRR